MQLVVKSLLRLARYIDSKTHRLDSFKYRLRIHEHVLRLLAPLQTAEERELFLRKAKINYIEEQIQSLTYNTTDIPIHFYILCVESIGDVIACEPIARFLKQSFPTSFVHWIVLAPYSEIVKYNPSINEIKEVSSLGEGYAFSKEMASNNGIIVNCHFNGWQCMRTGTIIHNPINPNVNIDTFLAIGNILQTYSLAAGLPPLDNPPIFHLRQGLLLPLGLSKGQYVVLHCHSTGFGKNWEEKKWHILADTMSNWGVDIVEIGTTRIIKHSKGDHYFDFCGKHDFQELAYLIKNATLFIGVDSCFAHIANAFRVDSIILMGCFRNYLAYTPFSGDFPHSKHFKILRAPHNAPAKELPVEHVITVVREMLSQKP